MIKADRNNKKRFYKFFGQGPEGASRGSGGNSAGAGQIKPLSMTVLEEAERELELRNWNTTYSITNNMLGDTIAAVKKRAQGDKTRLLEPFIRELYTNAAKVNSPKPETRKSFSLDTNISPCSHPAMAISCEQLVFRIIPLPPS